MRKAGQKLSENGRRVSGSEWVWRQADVSPPCRTKGDKCGAAIICFPAARGKEGPAPGGGSGVPSYRGLTSRFVLIGRHHKDVFPVHRPVILLNDKAIRAANASNATWGAVEPDDVGVLGIFHVEMRVGSALIPPNQRIVRNEQFHHRCKSLRVQSDAWNWTVIQFKGRCHTLTVFSLGRSPLRRTSPGAASSALRR